MSASRAELAKVWQEGFEAGEESVLSMGPDTNPYLEPKPVDNSLRALNHALENGL